MTNESLTKIVDAILEKYERAEAVQLIIELLQERSVLFAPQVARKTDSGYVAHINEQGKLELSHGI